MHNLPFSIIIPVYNDEKNITRCIESVISQSFSDFECLLVNDGSTDSTSSICATFAQNDSRLKIFNKHNEGISKTRQFGLDKSNGLYVIFIDSDDWVEPSFLEKINKKVVSQSRDIIFLDFYNEKSLSREKYYSQKPSFLSSESVIKDVLECKLFSCLWNVVLKKSFFYKYNIKFSDSINYGEDTLFITELLLNKPDVDYLDEAFYHHTFNRGSYTRKDKKNRFYERVKFLYVLELLLQKYNREDLIKNNFFPFNDKFEILSSGIFSKKEYKSLFALSFTQYYRECSNPVKQYLLLMAETNFYFFAKLISRMIKTMKIK